ncbi:MAG: lipid-A-disaccharide synthase, partial [Prevotella sp.]|nr:lipid-A-disaccharide synthase [Prevotella sp.]
LIANREVVKELVADSFSVSNIHRELDAILQGPARQQMLDGYAEVRQRLGDKVAPDEAARKMLELLNQK